MKLTVLVINITIYSKKYVSMDVNVTEIHSKLDEKQLVSSDVSSEGLYCFSTSDSVCSLLPERGGRRYG